jgi:biopolymer transport protein ExbB/TolQ
MEIKSLLAELAGVLFLPVTGLLLLLVAWMLIQTGLVLRGALLRLRGRRPGYGRYAARLAALPADRDYDLGLEEVVQAAEADAARTLSRVRFAVKVGPSLGLMGTLIPMSAALNGLAQGDLPSLAGNMVIAFSATVIGIAVGVVAYGLSLIQDAWIRKDLDALRLFAERLLRARETEA